VFDIELGTLKDLAGQASIGAGFVEQDATA
jgi:hypothetical protein